MKEQTAKILDNLCERYPSLNCCKSEIEKAFEILKKCFNGGGKLLLCGNGGSAADCEHIAGELLKCFKKKRAIDSDVFEKLDSFGEDGAFLQNKLEGGVAAVSLVSQTGIISAFANDKSWDAVFAQQLYAMGKEGDCLLTLSTSGNSKNCVLASIVAKAKNIPVISLTGEGGGKLKDICDCTIAVPQKETYLVQELHLPVYHCLCAMIEEELF